MDDMATTCCVQLSKREKYLEKLASSLVLFSYILPFKKNNAYYFLALSVLPPNIKNVSGYLKTSEKSQKFWIIEWISYNILTFLSSSMN